MKAGNTSGRGTRTDATRELIRQKALERGQQRSTETRRRVLAAMAAIEKEMASNDGVYPQNNGAVSAAEVARRAGVHATTFFSPKQRELGEQVRSWLESLKKSKAISVQTVKRSLAERIADWKVMYEGLAQSHRDTELVLQQVEAELSQSRKQLRALSEERDLLREQLVRVGGTSVVPLRPRKR